MSKLLVLFVGAIIVVLFLTGVVEVKFNADKTGEVPKLAGSLLKEKSKIERGRTVSVGLKRKVELFIVQDKEKRLVLSLLYVKTDAKRLKTLIDKKADPQALLPQAELL